MKHEIVSRTDEDTLAIGQQVGAVIPKGAFIALTGNLEVGKTMLVRGIARGLKVDAWAGLRSPGRTLMRTYHGGRFVLHHVDCYHLNQAPELPDQIESILGDPVSVRVVEWANLIRDLWPEGKVIEIEMSDARDAVGLTIDDMEDICPDLRRRLRPWRRAGLISAAAPKTSGERRKPQSDRRRSGRSKVSGERRRGDRRQG